MTEKAAKASAISPEVDPLVEDLEKHGFMIDRRRFLLGSASGLIASGFNATPEAILPAPPAQTGEPWYRNVYRRNVIDMHIADWNDKFLSELDPERYVQMLVLSKVKSAVVYTDSHVGLCYFPTKIGTEHKGTKGKNKLAQIIDGCHRNRINVVLYYSVIFDTHAYRTNPDWRITRANGTGAAEESRYGVCCPNSPYRDYVIGLVQEICSLYDFEGLRFDMTFWPAVCYCHYCQKRFADEVGGDLPRIINWEDPRWASFQRKREDWLVEFATTVTSTVRKRKPGASVEHQSSTYPLNWRFGVTYRLAKQNDFLQGDFYGGALQGSFVRKLLYHLTENLPYGFETSVMVNLHNHTAKKSKDLLRAKGYSSIADAGAFIFIDAIDPVGTLNESVYRRMGEVFSETQEYERFLGGKPCHDVGIYMSTESKCDFADNGKPPEDRDLSSKVPHVDAVLMTSNTCISNHMPFGVVTKKNLEKLSDHNVVVLPNVLMMDEEEANAIRAYVRNGGNLYASKYSSLITKTGTRKQDFLLSDVFGVSYMGETKEKITYIAPAEGHENLFPEYSAKYPVMLESSQIIVKAHGGAQVLGGMVLPYTDPADPLRFASIHSNPPGIKTDNPAVVFNHFGKGKVIFVSGDLENAQVASAVMANLLRLLHDQYSFEAVAPEAVEVTVFKQEDRKRFLVSVLNFQQELPNIPVDGIRIRVRLDNKKPTRLLILPKEQKVAFEVRNNYAEFTLPRLETFQMLALDYA